MPTYNAQGQVWDPMAGQWKTPENPVNAPQGSTSTQTPQGNVDYLESQGYTLDPSTGYYTDPSTGISYNPNITAGPQIDSATGQPYNPATGSLPAPTSAFEYDPYNPTTSTDIGVGDYVPPPAYQHPDFAYDPQAPYQAGEFTPQAPYEGGTYTPQAPYQPGAAYQGGAFELPEFEFDESKVNESKVSPLDYNEILNQMRQQEAGTGTQLTSQKITAFLEPKLEAKSKEAVEIARINAQKELEEKKFQFQKYALETGVAERQFAQQENQKFQSFMQGEQFAHQDYVETGKQLFQSFLQGESFAHQDYVNTGNQLFNKFLQDERFGHEDYVNAGNQAFQVAQDNYNKNFQLGLAGYNAETAAGLMNFQNQYNFALQQLDRAQDFEEEQYWKNQSAAYMDWLMKAQQQQKKDLLDYQKSIGMAGFEEDNKDSDFWSTVAAGAIGALPFFF